MPDVVSQLLPGALLFSGFVAGIFLLSKLVPGPKEQGVVLADGSRVTYELNGLRIFVLVAGGRIEGWMARRGLGNDGSNVGEK